MMKICETYDGIEKTPDEIKVGDFFGDDRCAWEVVGQPTKPGGFWMARAVHVDRPYDVPCQTNVMLTFYFIKEEDKFRFMLENE